MCERKISLLLTHRLHLCPGLAGAPGTQAGGESTGPAAKEDAAAFSERDGPHCAGAPGPCSILGFSRAGLAGVHSIACGEIPGYGIDQQSGSPRASTVSSGAGEAVVGDWMAGAYPDDLRRECLRVELRFPVSRHLVLVSTHLRQRPGKIFAGILSAGEGDRGGGRQSSFQV